MIWDLLRGRSGEGTLHVTTARGRNKRGVADCSSSFFSQSGKLFFAQMCFFFPSLKLVFTVCAGAVALPWKQSSHLSRRCVARQANTLPVPGEIWSSVRPREAEQGSGGWMLRDYRISCNRKWRPWGQEVTPQLPGSSIVRRRGASEFRRFAWN